MGVILFLIYINDINYSISEANIFLYADDTVLYVKGQTILQKCKLKIEIQLSKLDNWFKENKMKLNIDKTKFTCINSKSSTNTHINQNEIEHVKLYKC